MVKKTTPAETEAGKSLLAFDVARQFTRTPCVSQGMQGGLRDIDQTEFLDLTENKAAVSDPSVQVSLPPAKITSVADIGVLVRAARERQKLSQLAFADLAGVGRRFLSELENGKATLEFDKVLKVAAASGIDLFVKER